MRFHRPVLLVICTLLAATSVAAAATAPTPNWMRDPAISPDGSTLVFTSGGDLYRVPVEGGEAVALTLSDAWDGYPVWSPDGTWLAFSSDRQGNLDVYLMPAEGGEAKRLTWHSSADRPFDFSPDGKRVLFGSSRTDDWRNSQYPTRSFGELYSVSVEGGTPSMVFTTVAHAARYDARGQRILYENQPGYENAFRKHHTSSVTRDVYLYDAKKKTHRRITTFGGEDRNPIWNGDDALYFLSERSGDMNVFRSGLDDDSAAQQVTHFEHHPVRYLTRAQDGTLAFDWHGDIYVLPEGQDPRRVEITIHTDRQKPSDSMEELRRGITEFAVAPDGKEVAFVSRGEVFVTSVDFSTTRRITDTPEQERSVSFSPDGRSLLYAGERGGSWNVYMTKLADENEDYFFAATKLAEEPVVDTSEEEFEPRFSPDGKEIAYLAERTILKVKNLENGRIRTVMGPEYNYSYSDGDQWYDWSPDGKWFAVQFLSRGRYYAENVGLVPADGSADPRDISNSGYGNFHPLWAYDGNAVIWATDKFGQKNHGSWGGEMDVFATFMNQDAFDRFRRGKEDRELAEGRGKDDKKKDRAEDGEDDGDKQDDEDSEQVEPVNIDFHNMEDRQQKLTIHSSSLGDFQLTHDGQVLLYLARFEKGYDLWAHDFVEESTKLLSKLNARRASMEVVEDGKEVFLLADGTLKKISIKRSDGKPPEEGKSKSISLSPKMNIRPDEENAYLFEHAWRQTKEKFYNPDMHGVDWDWYHDQYVAKLPSIRHRRDFAELLSEMLGELNASHTGARYIGASGGEQTASLGAFFDPDFAGPGLKIAEVMVGGPMDDPKLGIEAGMIVTAIDGTELGDRVNVNRLLADRAGKRVRLGLHTKGGDVEKVLRPISLGRESQLRYRRWVEQRRAQVEKLSKGRIGYVHVRGMNDASFRVAYSEILGRYFDTDAMIVDTRFNGGGWLHDDLVVLLNGKHYLDFKPRNQAMKEQRFYGEPGRRWSKPSCVIMNEANYSDAHAFPWAYKKLGIGPLIGMPVAGTGTAVWWETLHTRDVFFGIPQVGMVDLDDGSYLENTELEPDYRVPFTAEDAAAGRDPQLAKAVEVMLKAAGDD
jgi:Tol biopolymer transport system component/C-terminal processing protease CtpA/Prc